MATPGATPLDDLKAGYAALCAALRDAALNPQPSYSEKGRSVSWNDYYNGLLDRIKKLAEIPGVAPDQNPSFEISEYL